MAPEVDPELGEGVCIECVERPNCGEHGHAHVERRAGGATLQQGGAPLLDRSKPSTSLIDASSVQW
eukprot:5827768-Prymnesium_polylepis.1